MLSPQYNSPDGKTQKKHSLPFIRSVSGDVRGIWVSFLGGVGFGHRAVSRQLSAYSFCGRNPVLIKIQIDTYYFLKN
jgi:hypothetical protein